jgi:spermidine synthase
VWSNEREGYGYDTILFGRVEPTVIDVDQLQRRLDRADHRLVKRSLREVGFGEGLDRAVEEGIDLLATYAGQAPMLKEWSRGAQINTDRNLRLQYLAGMWLNAIKRFLPRTSPAPRDQPHRPVPRPPEASLG